MRTITHILLGSALLFASTTFAGAAEHHHMRKPERAAVTAHPSPRNSNASLWPAPAVDPDWWRYANGALSAPAGH
jgi:hypothetical protein